MADITSQIDPTALARQQLSDEVLRIVTSIYRDLGVFPCTVKLGYMVNSFRGQFLFDDHGEHLHNMDIMIDRQSPFGITVYALLKNGKTIERNVIW